MGPIEVVISESKKVSCSGDKGSSSHPLIYLDMGNKDYVICPYCSKYFTTDKEKAKHQPAKYVNKNL